jgi:hypothetical protein
MKKLFGFIDKKPLIWFHYLPLVGVIVSAHYTSMLLGLETLTQTQPILGWTLLIGWYYAFLLIGDNLIHTILGVD